MRTISATTTALLAEDRIKAFALVKIDFAAGSVYATDYGKDLTYDGNTYLVSAGLLDFEPPQLSATVDRELYTITFADQDNILQTYFRAGAVGTPAEIYVGFVGASGPELGTDDLFLAYRGRIDEASIDNSFEEKVAVIGLSSPLANLDAVSAFWTTKAGMDQFSDTDTSFNNVLDDAEEIKVKWGKK